MPNLWPADLGTGGGNDGNPPVALLLEQAEELTKQTNNLLQGRVVSSRDRDTFVHQFFIVAPALENYSYRLLSISHPIENYPLGFGFDAISTNYHCANEPDYTAVLKDALAHERTRKIINALLAQIKWSKQAGRELYAETA
jgi:hypothetical protein